MKGEVQRMRGVTSRALSAPRFPPSSSCSVGLEQQHTWAFFFSTLSTENCQTLPSNLPNRWIKGPTFQYERKISVSVNKSSAWVKWGENTGNTSCISAGRLSSSDVSVLAPKGSKQDTCQPNHCKRCLGQIKLFLIVKGFSCFMTT